MSDINAINMSFPTDNISVPKLREKFGHLLDMIFPDRPFAGEASSPFTMLDKAIFIERKIVDNIIRQSHGSQKTHEDILLRDELGEIYVCLGIWDDKKKALEGIDTFINATKGRDSIGRAI